MEDFLDPFLLSPSWTELNAPARSSWNDTVSSQTNGLLAVPIDAYAEDEKSPAMRMIPSSHIMGNIATENLDENSGTLKYMSEHELANSNSHFCQNENEIQESNFSLNEVYESNSISGSYGQDLNTPHSALTMSSSIESSGSEPCKFAQSLADANSISSVSSMWPPSYSGVSSFVEQGKLQGFNFQDTDNDKYLHRNSSAAASLQDGNGLHSPIFPNYNLGQQIKAINGSFHPHKQEQNGMHNLQFPTFSAGPPVMPVKSAGLLAHQQSSEANNMKHQVNHSSGSQQAPPANTTGCNGTAKPRVRARRGQATDPHSIAERLRREKIAERMKNLQELVPNSDKTDKASMLDEIIDYVKFLQLQVKVLSMSRLGAAGAVVPLITDAQSEASSLHLSSSGQGGTDLSEAQDNLAFEQEVVKLMESNVTTAMQFLQNKGLCLMPIALASAISSHKGSYSAAIPQDKRKPNGSNGVISRENEVHNINRNGDSVKQEEPVKY